MNKKTIHRIIGAILAILFVGEIVYSVNNTELATRSTGETIQIVHNPWDTEIASSTVLGLVLEEAGYNVNLVSVDNAIMFESISTGESDVMTAAWLPTTHGTIIEEYEDNMVNLGPNLEGASTGIGVPSYMDVDSITDLDSQAEQTIIGIEPGAGAMIQTEEAMSHYDNISDWELEAPSTGAMLASVDEAIQNEEEFVFVAWTPHWMFLEYDIKMLGDPDFVYGEAEDIYTFTRLGFAEDHPEANEIVDRFFWKIDDMESVTLAMQNGTDNRTAAQNWINENRETVDSWLEGVFE